MVFKRANYRPLFSIDKKIFFSNILQKNGIYITITLYFIHKGEPKMALINCPECGKEISDKANSCPHCGCPIENGNNSDNYTICPECGGSNKIGETICQHCGHRYTVGEYNKAISDTPTAKKHYIQKQKNNLVIRNVVICILIAFFIILIINILSTNIFYNI